MISKCSSAKQILGIFVLVIPEKMGARKPGNGLVPKTSGMDVFEDMG